MTPPPAAAGSGPTPPAAGPTFATAARVAARLAATLGWSPDLFWAATPAELRTAAGLDLPAIAAPALAADLARLKEAFPDGHAR